MDSLFGVPMDTLMVVLVGAFGAVVGVVSWLAFRNRILVKLGLRHIPRRRGRALLIILGLMLATLLVSAAFNTGDTMTHTIRSTVLGSLGHIDEIVSVKGADTGSRNGPFREDATDVRYFDEALFGQVKSALGEHPLIDGIAPIIIEVVAVQNRTSQQNEPRVTLFASDPAHMAGFGEIQAQGGSTVSLADLGPGEVYLNESAADELNARPGDELLVFAAGQIAPLRVKAIVAYEGGGTDESGLLMPLGAAQRILGREGQIKHIAISNRGGPLSGVKHTPQVMAALEPVLDPLGLEADPTKEDALDLANSVGSLFTSFFVTFGTFSIIAGMMLIFLIFVMLAAERKSEMGMARAVGTQRRHLVQMFLFEGMVYDLAAAAVGALLGLAVAYGMVFIMAKAVASFGLDIRHDLRLRSLIVAYTLGMLLTFIVVTVSAWRVSVLNIVTAIRDLPDPVLRKGGRYTWVLGAFALLLGVLLTVTGLSAKEATPFDLGVSFIIMSLVPLLRRLGVPDRGAYTLPGLLLLLWWLRPLDSLDFLLPEMASDISIFIVAGIMVVVGGSWTVMYNSDLILGAIMAVGGRFRALAPVLKTAISYPLTNRFRTGMTVAMFSLVVFTLVVMATMTNAFAELFADEAAFSGGFDIRATTVRINPVDDMAAAIQESQSLTPSDFEVVANQSVLSLEARQVGGTRQEFESYPLRGLDNEFLAHNTYDLALIAEGYRSSREVWQALARDPGLAVVDPFPVPRRDNFNFQAGGPEFRLEGFFLEDKSFSPVPIEVRDPATGQTLRLTVIGVLKETAPLFMLGISASQEAVAGAFGAQAQPTIHLFKLREGVDVKATADALESTFLMNGMEADVLKEELDKMLATNLTFNAILQGFMGLGLVVGVAALGVISARSVVERRQQIGVLRAIGFRQRMVQLSFLIESSFVALLGIAVGAFLGLVMSFNLIDDIAERPNTENLKFAVPWLNLGIIFLISYGASLLTAFLPARQAARVYPAEALRYE